MWLERAQQSKACAALTEDPMFNSQHPCGSSQPSINSISGNLMHAWKHVVHIKIKIFSFFFFFFIFKTRFLAGLKLKNPPASAHPVVGLKVCTITAQLIKINLKKIKFYARCVAHTFHRSTVEAEAGGAHVWGQPGLQSEFCTSQGYTVICHLKN